MNLGCLNQILPGTGRGTMRSMVVGQVRRCVTSQAAGDAACAPPPAALVPLALRAVFDSPVPGRIAIATPKHYNDLIM